MVRIGLETYPVNNVTLGSLNGLPSQEVQLPVDTEAVKVRYMQGKQNVRAVTYSQIGLVSGGKAMVELDGDGRMPLIPLDRRTARLVKNYDFMVVKTPEANTGILYAREELLGNKNTIRLLKRLARQLY